MVGALLCRLPAGAVLVLAAGLATALLSVSDPGTALAAAPSITLQGAAQDGFTPDSDRDNVLVDATLASATASGSLDTERHEGDLGPPWYGFESTKVTCMVVAGNRIIVGAVGRAWHQGSFEPASKEYSPEQYVQLLDVEFGRFTVTPTQTPLPFRFGMLGERDEGVQSAVAPNCGAGWESFDAAFLPSLVAGLTLSPSINLPSDGDTSTGGVSVSGDGQPNTAVTVMVHEERRGGKGEVEFPTQGETSTLVDANGSWSATVEGVPPGGQKLISACADVTATASNVVDFSVLDAAAPLLAPPEFSPGCAVDARESFVAPAIATPAPGGAPEAGTVAVSGTGEPGTAVTLTLYEARREKEGTSYSAQGDAVALIDGHGVWSARLNDVPAGQHKVLSAYSDVYPSLSSSAEFEVAPRPPEGGESGESTERPAPHLPTTTMPGSSTLTLGPQSPPPPQGLLGPTPEPQLTNRSLVVSASGALTLPISCPPGQSCAGSVGVRTFAKSARTTRAARRRSRGLLLASGSFSVAGGQVARVKLSLSSEALALLRRRHVLRAIVTVAYRDRAGHTRTSSTEVTLRLRARAGKNTRR
jgi:hypothetical protein